MCADKLRKLRVDRDSDERPGYYPFQALTVTASNREGITHDMAVLLFFDISAKLQKCSKYVHWTCTGLSTNIHWTEYKQALESVQTCIGLRTNMHWTEH